MRCDKCTEKPCGSGMACTACDAAALYADETDRRMMRAASEVEAEYYGEANRIQEIIIFSQKMGYKKLGIAFCAAFSEEAAKLGAILDKYFEIATVNCKVCGVPKSEMGAMESDRIGNISCNPIEQAAVLNDAKTDLNILMGLCVGHDALFIKPRRPRRREGPRPRAQPDGRALLLGHLQAHDESRIQIRRGA